MISSYFVWMRIKKLQNYMKEKKIDISLFLSFEKPNTNIIYFTDYSGKGILCVTKTKSFLIIPEYETEKITNKKVQIYISSKTKMLFDELILHIKNYKKIAIEEDLVSVYMFKKIKNKLKGRYYDVSSICKEIRTKKEVSELKKIKKACSVSDLIFEKICKNFKFKTEDEIREFIKKECEKNKCELAFPPIAASAEGTSKVHYEGSKKLKKCFLMLDFGAKYKGYCSDMTRMLYLGTPTKKEIEDYNLVLKTNKSCEKAVVVKKKFLELHNLAVEILEEKSKFFTHFLGHGLGLDIHESPTLGPDSKTKIKENIPFTIEPGIYFPNKYGIRIEDTLVLEKNKIKILTKSKKELVIIK